MKREGKINTYGKINKLESWSNDWIAKKIGTLPEEEVAAYRKEHPYEKLDKEAKGVHKAVSKLINKSTKFTLGIDDGHEVYNIHTVPYDWDRAVFPSELLELCLGK